MKPVLIFILISFHFTVQSQDIQEINLSKTLNEKRLGLWDLKDYKVYISLDEFEYWFRSKGNSFLNPDFKNYYSDSVIASYNHSGKIYLDIADQLKQAETGYDLRNLKIYDRREDRKDSMITTDEVETTIKQFLRSGNAVVYYLGKRVFTLKALYEYQGTGLDYGENITIYSDTKENYVVKEYLHLGW